MKRRLFVLCVVIGWGGCAHVPRYDRERLAHHSMREADYAGVGEQHLRAVQEGVSGAGLDAAGGCGCN